MQPMDWTLPHHVSGSVAVEFRGSTPRTVLIRNHAGGETVETDLHVLSVLSAFSEPAPPEAVLGALEGRLGLDGPSLREAIEVLAAKGVLVPWRAAIGKGEALGRMAGVDRWYHAFEVVPGLHTPGEVAADPGRLDAVGVPRDLTGLRVLDIGAWDGAYTFELERRGAEVVAMDIQDPAHTGFDAARRIRGSAAAYRQGSVYELSPETAGRFDVVVYLGVFYHLKNPLLGFANIHRVLEDHGVLHVEGAVLDTSHAVDARVRRHRDAIETLSDLPIAYFAPGDFHGHWSNWFVPNLACLGAWLEATGFTDVDLRHIGGNRAGGRAAKDPAFDPIEHEVI